MKREDLIKYVAKEGQDGFWRAVAGAAPPGVRSGDFPPDATAAFDYACEAAVRVWLEYNMPLTVADYFYEVNYVIADGTDTATAYVRVLEQFSPTVYDMCEPEIDQLCAGRPGALQAFVQAVIKNWV